MDTPAVPPAGAQELGRLDAVALGALVRRGEVSSAELLEATLARIDAVDPRLGAVVTRFDDLARSRLPAAAAAAGPLAGVPYLLKDLGADDAGVRCTEGSRSLADRVPQVDSELVRRLKSAGLVIAGRTATPEFGNGSTTDSALFGVTRNPWDLDRTTGGSSGGSAAAVASGMVPAAHGSDGGGSIRTPSACCGLYGLKPSRGRVSNAPGPDLLAGWNVEHALTRSVRDSAALLDAASGPAPGDPFVAPAPERPFLEEVGRPPGRLRIALDLRPPSGAALDPDCERVTRETARLLESLGHELVETSPAIDWDQFLAVYLGIVGGAFAAMLDAVARADPAAPERWEPLTVAYAERGWRLSAGEYLTYVGQLEAINRVIGRFFAGIDIWLTPTLTRPALPLGMLELAACGGFDGYMRLEGEWNPWLPMANCSGRPSATLPLGSTAAELPVGVLLTGRHADEATLLRLSAQLEEARPWADRWPPVNAVGAA